MPAKPKFPARKKRGQLPAPLPVDVPITARSWDRRGLAIGVLGTLLFHLLLFILMPRSLVVLDPLDPNAGKLPDDLEINLQEEEQEGEEEERRAKPRYVETNPEVPDNEPDETLNFSARNQQAANEKVPEELSADKTPAREGEEDLPFDKAFTGTLDQTITAMPTPATSDQQAMEAQDASEKPKSQNPPSGFDDARSDNPDGLASSVAEPAPNPKVDARSTEGDEQDPHEARPEVAASVATPERPAPAPRPRLPRALPGPVKSQPAGVSQTGRTAVNAKFGPYGDYIERLQEAIQQRWDALCRQRSISDAQTRVVLEFTLTKDGLIQNLETVETTSQALGILLCRTAIEQGQSYGEWSKEMTSLLGEEQNITFTFYYW